MHFIGDGYMVFRKVHEEWASKVIKTE
jgi:hypothetical protein